MEIAGGLGPTSGLVWRIGVMGANATSAKVDRALHALGDAIQAQRTPEQQQEDGPEK